MRAHAHSHVPNDVNLGSRLPPLAHARIIETTSRAIDAVGRRRSGSKWLLMNRKYGMIGTVLIQREPRSVLATKDQELMELRSTSTREWNG